MHVLVATVVHHPADARILHRQIRALCEAGHTVTFLAPFGAYGSGPPPFVRAVDVPRAAGRRRLAALRGARREIARHAGEADLVLLHDPELLLAVTGLRGLPPVVWDVHEDTPAAVTLKPWLPRVLRPAAARAIRAVELVAERRYRLLLAEEGYRGRFRRPHPVVPNLTWVPPTAAPAGDDRVVYVGHLTHARGGAEMIEAAELLAGAVRVELVGAADGRLRDRLEQARRQGALHWHGFVPNAEAVRLLDGALAGLALLHDEPNYRHSLPTKIIEYMAHGVPVITTPVPSARELVQRHECGLVVPFQDPAAVAAAVRRLRDDPALREEMGRRGHEAARTHYDWPAAAAEFVAQLEEWAALSPRAGLAARRSRRGPPGAPAGRRRA